VYAAQARAVAHAVGLALDRAPPPAAAASHHVLDAGCGEGRYLRACEARLGGMAGHGR